MPPAEERLLSVGLAIAPPGIAPDGLVANWAADGVAVVVPRVVPRADPGSGVLSAAPKPNPVLAACDGLRR